MTAHAAIAASPKTTAPSRALMQALLVSRIAYILGDDEDPTAFDPRGEDGSPVTLVIGYRGQFFWFDEDSVAGHDGTTVIVTSATGGRYLVNDINLLITSVISKIVTTPPDPDDVDEEERPSNGDSYIVPPASTGPWATWTGSIATWVAARSEWFRILPKAGWYVSVPGATRDTVYRYDSVQSDWITGDGSTATANSIPLSAIQGVAASLTVRVENQTTYAPPGARKTGATPAMPLGGTASNINDNSDSTSATTSALGNLTGAAMVDRIIAKLTLAAAADLISLEARGVLGSAVSSTNHMGLWYSTNNGASWTQAGTGFTLSTAAQNIQRNGSFAGVTDIALVTEAKNWSTATNTVAGLNAFDATVTGTVGDGYVVGSPAIGIFAGMEGKVARCEVADTFTFYTPAVGDEVFDKAIGSRISWNGSSWESSISGYAEVTEAEALTTSALSVTGSAGTPYSYSASTPPTSTADFSKLSETLTIDVQADVAGQEFEVEYLLGVNGKLAFSPFAVTVTNFGVVAAIFVDSETNARDWQLLFQRNQTSGSPEAALLDQFEPRSIKFKVTMSDTSLHTLKIKFLITMVGGSAVITSSSMTVTRRRIIARKISS